MKTIKKRMLITFGITLSILMLILGITISTQVNNIITPMAKYLSQEIVSARSNQVGEKLQGYVDELKIISESDIVKSMDYDKIKPYLKSRVVSGKHAWMGIVLPNGKAWTTTDKEANVTALEYYTEIFKNGKDHIICQPFNSVLTGGPITVIAYAVKDQNNKTVAAVFTVLDLKIVSNITNNITINNTGYGWIIDKNGLFFTHPDKNIAMKLKISESSKKGYQGLDDLTKQSSSSDSGNIAVKTPDGSKKLIIFSKIPNSPSWTLGVSVSEAQLMSKINKLLTITVCLILMTIVIFLFISVIIANKIASPITISATHLENISKGDFTLQISDEYLNRKDEIGSLGRSMKTMQSSISSTFKTVLKNADDISSKGNNMTLAIDDLFTQANETAATIQQLSAGMEQSSASIQEINASSSDIKNTIENMSQKVKKGAASISEIKNRAEILKQNSVKSEKETSTIYGNSKIKLETAIEKSKAVDKIKTLSDSILKISSQTDLLALNAAIEASRAGEAGRGFSVVAEEIKKLAETSKNTITEIQNIVDQVVSSVSNLSSNSQEILTFIDSKVLKDYKAMLKIGEDYNKDAELIDNLFNDFNASSKELNNSMSDITEAINDVAKAINESASGSQNIAETTTVTLEKVKEVTDLIEKSNEKVEQLESIISQFKIS